MCNKRKVVVKIREKDYYDLLKKFNVEIHPSHIKECIIEVPDNEDSYKYLSTKDGIINWKFSNKETVECSNNDLNQLVDILKENFKKIPDTIDLLKLLKGIYSIRLISPGFSLTANNLNNIMIPKAILSQINITEDSKYLEYLKNLSSNPYTDIIESLKLTWNKNNSCINFNKFFNTVFNIN